MWCNQCQQDVPGLFSADASRYRCPRCAAELSKEVARQTAEIPFRTLPSQPSPNPGQHKPTLPGPEPPPPYDGWELEQRLRHIERVLRIDQGVSIGGGGDCQPRTIRFDAAHAGASGWHCPQATEARSARRLPAAASSSPSWLPLLTWSVLAFGLMAFTCGGVLVVWSLVTGRQDLWPIGMPIGLGGQIVLLFGLVLQLDRLWHDNRHTVQKLHRVGEQLQDLNTTTTLLGSHSDTGSRSFYAHLAGGASPQLLLADLKSQLDLLAVRLGQTER